MKQKLLISFSGGQTSAYMLQWLLKNKAHQYDFQIVFANTGCENDQTLDFVQNCSIYFNCNIIWVERNFGKQNFKIVDHKSATRLKDYKNGKNPFELAVQKYGLPNNKRLWTTRELKLCPITGYLRSIGWKKYQTAIGIRIDEIDRMSINRDKNQIIYPLIQNIPTTKNIINDFWKKQPFRLNLQNYQGNCVFCYKKSIKKLCMLYHENPKQADFFNYLEQKYAYYIPKKRLEYYAKINKPTPKPPYTMYRDNLTLKQIYNLKPTQNTLNFDFETETSCEIFSECGIDN